MHFIQDEGLKSVSIFLGISKTSQKIWKFGREKKKILIFFIWDFLFEFTTCGHLIGYLVQFYLTIALCQYEFIKETCKICYFKDSRNKHVTDTAGGPFRWISWKHGSICFMGYHPLHSSPTPHSGMLAHSHYQLNSFCLLPIHQHSSKPSSAFRPSLSTIGADTVH